MLALDGRSVFSRGIRSIAYCKSRLRSHGVSKTLCLYTALYTHYNDGACHKSNEMLITTTVSMSKYDTRDSRKS